MKILILYFFAFNIVLQASAPVLTNSFIKPVVNLNEFYQDKQEAFIAFEGTPGLYKTTKLYVVNQDNKLEEKKDFIFKLSEKNPSSFFAAHKGHFTGKQTKELVLLVKDPSIGTKVYVWEITETGFKRRYEEAHIINLNQPLSQPIQSIKTKQKNGKDQITISFGSPNRNIVVLDFNQNNIKEKTNIAEQFLQNQAGTMFIASNTNKEEILVFNSGEPTQSQTILGQTTTNTTKDYNIRGAINQVFLEENKEPVFLINFNKLYFSEEEQTISLSPKHKHKKIIDIKKEQIVLLDATGALLTYEIKKENKQAALIKKIKSPFKNNQKTKNIEHFKNKNTTYLTAQIEGKNYFSIQGKTNPKQKEPPSTSKQDTLILTVKEKQSIPIILNNKHEFLELKIEEQPKELELNLDNMSFVWEPKEQDKGYNVLKYHIIYNVGSNIIKTTPKEGKTALNKEVTKEKHNQTHTLYVNSPPTISTEKDQHKVQLGHTLKIPINIQDANKEQKLELTYFPQIKGAKLENKMFIWEPEKEQEGYHTITFIVKDEYSENRKQNTVYVDTLKKTTTSKQQYTLTVNKEFILDLSTGEAQEYTQTEGPENSWISAKGVLHWIPLSTQLGTNKIIIERKGTEKTENHIVSAFVNSPPIISYRPDQTEHINYLEEFSFKFKSFDANTDQQLYWKVTQAPTNMKLTEKTTLEWKGDKLDYNFYTIEITDSINADIFNGTIYVNDIPRIVSEPKKFIQLGEFFSYEIKTEDKNTLSPINQQEANTLLYVLHNQPKTMKLDKNTIIWEPKEEDIGLHKIEVEVSDGISKTNQIFSLNVNDLPTISSPDSINVMVGDTLNQRIEASDKNQKTKLTYSIRTTIPDMYLNANTGEITWIPTPDDIGEHVVEVAVSDGFATGNNMKKITIFVSSYPEFLTFPPTEAYVNLDYIYYISAQDAEENKTPNEDVFVNLKNTTFSNLNLDSLSFIISSTPASEDIGKQTITLELSDKKQSTIEKTFEILVLETSPCEPEKTEIIEETDKKEKNKMKRLYKILLGVVGGALIGESNK